MDVALPDSQSLIILEQTEFRMVMVNFKPRPLIKVNLSHICTIPAYNLHSILNHTELNKEDCCYISNIPHTPTHSGWAKQTHG